MLTHREPRGGGSNDSDSGSGRENAPFLTETDDGKGRGGPRNALHGHVPEHVHPQAAGALFFAMDAGEDVGEAPAAGRPAPLLEVLPQERVQRRTVEQIVDPVPVVPMLFMVEPQMVE